MGMPSRRTNNLPESGRGLGHVTPQFLAVQSAILATAWLLVYSMHTHYFVFPAALIKVVQAMKRWVVVMRCWCRFTLSCLETMKRLMQGRLTMISGKSSDVEQLIRSYWLYQGLTQCLRSPSDRLYYAYTLYALWYYLLNIWVCLFCLGQYWWSRWHNWYRVGLMIGRSWVRFPLTQCVSQLSGKPPGVNCRLWPATTPSTTPSAEL